MRWAPPGRAACVPPPSSCRWPKGPARSSRSANGCSRGRAGRPRRGERARPGQAPVGVCVNVSSCQIQHPASSRRSATCSWTSGLSPGTAHPRGDRVAAGPRDRGHRARGCGSSRSSASASPSTTSGPAPRRSGTSAASRSTWSRSTRRFVDGIGTGSEELALVRAMVELAHSLSMTVVAEGVELEASHGPLEIGSDRAQGFLFGPSADASVAMATVRRPRDPELLGRPRGPRAGGHQVGRRRLRGGQPGPAGRRPRRHGRRPGGRRAQRTTVPNVISTFESDPQGSFSGPDGLVDLAPYLRRDGIEASTFTDASESYTRYRGRRWALPLLADATGLYLNRSCCAKAASTLLHARERALHDGPQADEAPPGRFACSRWVQPAARFLRELARAVRAPVRCALDGRWGPLLPRHGSGVGPDASLAEAARGLVRLRRSGPLRGERRGRVLAVQRLCDRPARDDARRRVADRLPRRRSAGARLSDGAGTRGRRATGAVWLRVRERQHHRHPGAGWRSGRTPGSWCGTSPPTTKPS